MEGDASVRLQQCTRQINGAVLLRLAGPAAKNAGGTGTVSRSFGISDQLSDHGGLCSVSPRTVRRVAGWKVWASDKAESSARSLPFW